MRNSFFFPVLVLSLICLVMTAALALVNNVTGPIIARSARYRAESAMLALIPQAVGFEQLSFDSYPPSVQEAYRTLNDEGYIFVVLSSGYGGPMRIIAGIDSDGRIIRTAVLAHSETPGLGTIAFDRAGAYEGKDSSLEGVDVVSGATITYLAHRRAIEEAFEAYRIVREMGR
ncbi:MAG: FMN-binding protein [Treponema sp.]|nr:FMN-binding protein [Treponema sp.]